MQQINQMQLMSAMILDAHNFKESAEKVNTDSEALERGWMTRRTAHVQDVQAVQKEMQNLDVHIDIETAQIGNRKFQYIRDAAAGAKTQISKLQKFYAFGEEETLVISVYQLFSLGTTKKLVVEQIRNTLDSFPGFAFIIYPRLPKNARHTTKKGASVDASADAHGDDEDLDEDFNDIDAEGDLPEILSQDFTVVGSAELTAQLTRDHFEVEDLLLRSFLEDPPARVSRSGLRFPSRAPRKRFRAWS